MAHRVTFIPGDGTGPEIAEATRRVLEASGAELGELVLGTKPGRASPDEITLYKSVGVAVQDAAAAALVLAAAREQSSGQEIELEGTE